MKLKVQMGLTKLHTACKTFLLCSLCWLRHFGQFSPPHPLLTHIHTHTHTNTNRPVICLSSAAPVFSCCETDRKTSSLVHCPLGSETFGAPESSAHSCQTANLSNSHLQRKADSLVFSNVRLLISQSHF